MREFPHILLKARSRVVHVVTLTLFYLLTALWVEPRLMTELLHTGEGSVGIGDVYAFNLSISVAIVFVTLALARLLLGLLQSSLKMGFKSYLAWCAGEIAAVCAFSALYFVLMSSSGASWFAYLARCAGAYAPVLTVCYIILTLAYCLAQSPAAADNDVRLKFYDSRHVLKFAIPASSVLYLQADENYINVHYSENGRTDHMVVRSSLKSVEQMCLDAGFLRTHRSYIVNPAHITTLRKDESGAWFADIDAALGYGIPVSRKFYDSISKTL